MSEVISYSAKVSAGMTAGEVDLSALPMQKRVSVRLAPEDFPSLTGVENRTVLVCTNGE